MKKLIIIIIICFCLLLYTGCSKDFRAELDNSSNILYDNTITGTGNEFKEITENEVLLVSENPTSTFSMDVNTAAYANLRRYINNGNTINKNQVRIEEMVNYFKYDYPEPIGENPLSINTTISQCPWNSEANLLSIGLHAKNVEISDINNNLVFLLDVSGSMSSQDKLGLMQTAFSLLVDNLNDDDTVSIVTYAGSDSIILQGAKGTDKLLIKNKIEDLTAGGSTAGADGINTAYALAEEYFISGGNNRVILATDGDFNVGISTEQGLNDFISEKRQSNIYLSVLGFGYGNLKDNKLQTLANSGNGNYGYIDSITEAKKILVEEIGGTLKTVAKDVKTQVEFNPAKIYSYRLLGYENKLLTNEDWQNDEKDAGEIGAGHTVTAVYEIVLKDSDIESTMNNNYLKTSIRYKDPEDETEEVKEIYEFTTVDNLTQYPNEDQQFISAVVEAALVMRNSEYKGNANLENVIARLNLLNCVQTDIYKSEFLTLMQKLNNA